MSTGHQHPMAVVSRRTGLHPDLIRAWERRHGAVCPKRTPGNRRLYSDADVRRLKLIRSALRAGFRIGNVAPLADAEIERLIETDEAAEPPRRRRSASVRGHVERCLDHVMALDGDSLLRDLEKASVDLSRIDLMDRLIAPLMEEVGRGCAEGRCRIAHEHLASAVTRSFLDTVRAAYPIAPTAPGIVVTTPLHQHHELAAMVVAATARTEGWNTTYLGPNLPAEEIASATRSRGARVVALSITWPAEDPNLSRDLPRLRRLLADDVTIVVGGRSAGGYDDILEEIGAVRPESLAGFRELLWDSGAQPRKGG